MAPKLTIRTERDNSSVDGTKLKLFAGTLLPHLNAANSVPRWLRNRNGAMPRQRSKRVRTRVANLPDKLGVGIC